MLASKVSLLVLLRLRPGTGDRPPKQIPISWTTTVVCYSLRRWRRFQSGGTLTVGFMVRCGLWLVRARLPTQGQADRWARALVDRSVFANKSAAGSRALPRRQGPGKTRLRVRVERFQGGGDRFLAHLNIVAEYESQDALDQLGVLYISPGAKNPRYDNE